MLRQRAMKQARTNRVEQRVAELMRHDIRAGARHRDVRTTRVLKERQAEPIVERVEIGTGVRNDRERVRNLRRPRHHGSAGSRLECCKGAEDGLSALPVEELLRPQLM